MECQEPASFRELAPPSQILVWAQFHCSVQYIAPDFGPCPSQQGPGLPLIASGPGVVIGGAILEGLCILLEPCGAIELIDIGIAGTAAAGIVLLSDRNQGDVGHNYVRDMARGWGGDYCTALKQIQDLARRSGNGKLFNDAKATYKADCRGK